MSTMTVEEAKTEGLSDDEIKMGIENGGIDREEEPSEEPKEEVQEEQETPEEETVEEEVKPEEELEALKEKIIKGEDLTAEEEKKVHEFSKNEKGLYFSQKAERARRQQAVKQNELLQAKLNSQMTIINDLKTELEDFRKDLGEEAKPRTEAEIKKEIQMEDQIASQELALKRSKLAAIEADATINDENFPKVLDIFTEIANSDTKIRARLEKKAEELMQDDDPLVGDEIVDLVYRVAKKDPRYKDIVKPVNEDGKEEAKKIVKNLEKKRSSASVGTSGSVGKTSEEDLTADDVLNMSQAQWDNLSSKTRERLLMKG
jgi:hypothetical protein